MVPHRMSPQLSASARGSGNLGGTSVERSDLVPSPPGDVVR